MIEMTELEVMEERKNRQEETIKTFKEGLDNKRSYKNLIKNGEVDKEALLDALKLAFPDIILTNFTDKFQTISIW